MLTIILIFSLWLKKSRKSTWTKTYNIRC
jgi:hypothetical protein